MTETLKGACEARGHGFQRITRNADEEHYDADLAGLMGFGDVSGAKNSTQKTWLQDAADAGARFVVNCRVERVLVEDGRAAGVEGTYVDADGRTARVTVRAPHGRRRGRRARHARPCCCAAASAARPPATTCACIPATAIAGVYDAPQKALVGPAAVRAVDGDGRPRGRLRLPHRDLARLARRERRRRSPGTAARRTRRSWPRAP